MKIKISLEYHCYPVWLYNANGILIANDLPNELKRDKELDEIFIKIQTIYDNLFIDNSYEFKYIGFSDNELKKQFSKDIDNAIETLTNKLNTNIVIEKNILL